MKQLREISVTTIPCSCNYLADAASDPALPIKFDSQLNEYSFVCTLPAGTRVSMTIYHCPMCGGVASESQRGKLFASVTPKEAGRLNAAINGLETIEKIEATLGTADDDQIYHPPADLVEKQPRTGHAETGAIRVLTFTRLSKTADVQFRVYSNGEIQRSIAPKYIGMPTDTNYPVSKRKPSVSGRSRRRVRAEAGDPKAQFALARELWLWGRSASDQDKLEAMKWYRSAGEQGHLEAQRALGGILMDSTEPFYDPREGMAWLGRAAEQGDVGAQHLIAVQLATGEVVARDPKRAAYWYRKAAHTGDAAAEYNLGMMYWRGDGVPKSATTARKWLAKAGTNGDMAAVNLLADAYATGEFGFPIDDKKARYWQRQKRRLSQRFARRRRK